MSHVIKNKQRILKVTQPSLFCSKGPIFLKAQLAHFSVQTSGFRVTVHLSAETIIEYIKYVAMPFSSSS